MRLAICQRSQARANAELVDDFISDHEGQSVREMRDDSSDWIHEAVDNHGYMVYYSDHEAVLNFTDAAVDEGDLRCYCEGVTDWRKMRQIEAFLSMRQDVEEAVFAKLRELEEAEEEREDEDNEPEDPERYALAQAFIDAAGAEPFDREAYMAAWQALNDYDLAHPRG